jgi:hypothetical protein
MNRELKLSEYASQICDALEANPTNADGQRGDVNVRLSPEHAEYRLFISNVIRNAFCSVGAHTSDTLFTYYRGMSASNMQLIKRIEELSKAADKPVKPKRVIQSAPKKGKIPKAKIEKAVKEVKKNEMKKLG